MEESKELVFESVDELESYVLEMINNMKEYENANISKVVFRIKPPTVHMYGVKYDGAINASIAKSIISLQESVYRTYRVARYHDTKTTRTPEDERLSNLELYVRISEGSIISDIINLDEVFKELVSNMDGWKFGSLVVIATALLCYKLYDRHQSKVEELARINASSEAVKEIAETNEMIVDMAKDINRTSSLMFKAMSDSSERTEINGKSYDKRELLEISKEKLDASSAPKQRNDDLKYESVSGSFLVREIKFDGDMNSQKRTITLYDSKTGIKYPQITLTDGDLSPEKRALLIDAIDKKPLDLELAMTRNSNDEIKGVSISKFNGESLYIN